MLNISLNYSYLEKHFDKFRKIGIALCTTKNVFEEGKLMYR